MLEAGEDRTHKYLWRYLEGNASIVCHEFDYSLQITKRC